MAKKKIGRMITGGRMEIKYGDDGPIKDDANSLAFKEELAKWNENPRKYWWEHGGKEKIRNVIIVIIGASIVITALFLLR